MYGNNEVGTIQVTENFGNPSSIHSFGRESRKWLDSTRELIAQEIGAHPNEIVFTSGGTEADNMAILGSALAREKQGRKDSRCCQGSAGLHDA
ncbi:aminotransferase class V-fold PLP-dependent enzyme [Bacillus licheniformis]|nr:aminotransferase class V-fold PLP-dependent enzyme [Bacillus licheniformis]